jgi:hypothetical protein
MPSRYEQPFLIFVGNEEDKSRVEEGLAESEMREYVKDVKTTAELFETNRELVRARSQDLPLIVVFSYSLMSILLNKYDLPRADFELARLKALLETLISRGICSHLLVTTYKLDEKTYPMLYDLVDKFEPVNHLLKVHTEAIPLIAYITRIVHQTDQPE